MSSPVLIRFPTLIAFLIACTSEPELSREQAASLLRAKLCEGRTCPDSVEVFDEILRGELQREEKGLWRFREESGEIIATFYRLRDGWTTVLSRGTEEVWNREIADTTIMREIKTRMDADPRLNDPDIQIEAHSMYGQVTLVGVVPTRRELSIAREVAMSTPGVRQVWLDSVRVLLERDE